MTASPSKHCCLPLQISFCSTMRLLWTLPHLDRARALAALAWGALLAFYKMFCLTISGFNPCSGKFCLLTKLSVLWPSSIPLFHARGQREGTCNTHQELITDQEQCCRFALSHQSLQPYLARIYFYFHCMAEAGFKGWGSFLISTRIRIRTQVCLPPQPERPLCVRAFGIQKAVIKDMLGDRLGSSKPPDLTWWGPSPSQGAVHSSPGFFSNTVSFLLGFDMDFCL